jgi:hypothetical protein
VRVGAPPALRDSNFPDRRGPGLKALEDARALPRWLITAQVEISRRREIDAQTSVEVLLHNLVHRRMVNEAHIVKVEQNRED